MSQVLVKLVDKLTPNQKRFLAEVIGTFIVVVFATGSIVIDARLNKELGIPFIAFAPFVGIAIGVYIFGKISMAHFNPAVTIGFLITKHVTKIQFAYYLCAGRPVLVQCACKGCMCLACISLVCPQYVSD